MEAGEKENAEVLVGMPRPGDTMEMCTCRIT
jgi:hypothetical protein